MKLHYGRATLGLMAVGLLNACSAPEPIADPTWSDVYPILQGQCLHCHGSTASADGGGFRFDFLNAALTCQDAPGDDLASGYTPPPNFVASRRQIQSVINPGPMGLRAKMPPEPARLLEDWQKQTLENFIVKLDAVGVEAAKSVLVQPPDARSPRIEVTFARLNNDLHVDYTVLDDNGDPVIGQLRVGGGLPHRIEAAGRGQARFDLSGVVGSPGQITARLCDGWAIRTRGAADGLPLVP